jgi:hypothetical protein
MVIDLSEYSPEFRRLVEAKVPVGLGVQIHGDDDERPFTRVGDARFCRHGKLVLYNRAFDNDAIVAIDTKRLRAWRPGGAREKLTVEMATGHNGRGPVDRHYFQHRFGAWFQISPWD